MTGDFFARLFVIDGQYVKTKFWSNELEPMDFVRRSTDEWAEESVTSHFGPECFGVPAEGSFQVLVHAKIIGELDCCREYDEDIEVIDVWVEPMPERYEAQFI